ncbi:MAG: methyltransferase domain-containing protein [Bryobacterales bacterium]|nr:methyltransferase domain-containing protein [Bryobacterales bacterium]
MGPGPWMVQGGADLLAPARRTADADPRRVYHNLSIAIDPERQLYNGAPGVVATWLDALALSPEARVLHIGCGTGYYSAIIAEVVGPGGSVVAVDVDEDLAERARVTLLDWPTVSVICGDGSRHGAPLDAIVVQAGITHPLTSWLDALAPGGGIVMPLTVSLPGMSLGKGVTVIARRAGTEFDARVLQMTMIYTALGIRDPGLEPALGQAMRGFDFMAVRRLRQDPHEKEPACWLHGPEFCLSR